MANPTLLGLPAELREQIYIHAITNWTCSKPGILSRQPIRIDKFNHPVPPPLTLANHQLRSETLHLYYNHNTFELWRPKTWAPLGVAYSTLVSWLQALGPERMGWLRDVVLLYKREGELEYDVFADMAKEGAELKPEVMRTRLEQTEYEMCYEMMGLPRKFGKVHAARWCVSAPAN